MEMDLSGVVNPSELEAIATRFRDDLGMQLSESLQVRLNEALGPDMRIAVRVVVESVAMKNPARETV